jgi:DHA3 family multidrug efflux protein-like MFS transporter
MVGTVTGISFAVTSVFSGLVIGNFGMGGALYGSVALTVACLLHLQTIHIEEPEPERVAGEVVPKVDVRGALDAIHAVPGLAMLIALAAFNNLLSGVFMALMDAYGLELVSVETWGFLWGFLSGALILGGLAVARRGLGARPLRLIILFNLVNWTVCATFTLRSSIVPLAIGMFVYMALIPVIEAAEQTVLQRSIPYERQGRVFGFAQLVENAAAPVTAFLIGPIAETFVMPSMTDGAGADAIGGWFGTGSDRGLALMFVLSGLFGIVVTLLAWGSRSYRNLSQQLEGPPVPVPSAA